MKKQTIVFSSSSDESDSEEIKVIPQAKNPAQTITLASEYSYDYEDSTSSNEPVNIKQPIHPVRQVRPQPGRPRPLASKNLHQQRPNITPKRTPAIKKEPIQITEEEEDDDDYEEDDSDDQLAIVQVKSTPQTKKPHPPPPSSQSQQQQKPQEPQQQTPKPEKNAQQTFAPRPPPNQQQDDANQFEINGNGNDSDNNDEEEASDNAIFEINPQNSENRPNEENIIPQTLATPTRHFPITDSMKTFMVQRTKKHSIRGKSYIYSFYRNSQPLLYSKCVSRHPKGTMPITSNPDVHIKGTSDYSITVDNSCRSFVIKSATQTVLTFTIDIPSKIPKLPHLTVEIDPTFPFEPKAMTSKRPIMSKKGCWVLDFHNKFTLPSEKNAIFIESSAKTKDEDLIVVRKVAKDRIEIDCNLVPTDVVIFGIGLAAFLGKLK